MKTREERRQELNQMVASDEGRERIVQKWKDYYNRDPGHWRPAEGWNYPELIEDILEHEYAGTPRTCS